MPAALRGVDGGDEFPIAIAHGHMAAAARAVEMPVERLGAFDFFAAEQSTNVGAIEVVVDGFFLAGDAAKGGQQSRKDTLHTARLWCGREMSTDAVTMKTNNSAKGAPHGSGLQPSPSFDTGNPRALS